MADSLRGDSCSEKCTAFIILPDVFHFINVNRGQETLNYNFSPKELSITPLCFCVFPSPKKTDFKLLPHWVSDFQICLVFSAVATAVFV